MTTDNDAPQSNDLRRATSRLVDRALVPASIVLIVFSIALVLTFDYGRDQAIYALVAREILAGRMPYRDAFDFKPPGIFLVYTFARAVFGASQHGIRIVEAASMVGTIAGLVRLARIHFGDAKIGFVAGAMASFVHAQLDFWHTGQPESFGGMLTVAGLVTTTAALGWNADGEPSPPRAPKRFALWLATGALFGLAGLMKPPLAGGGAVVAAMAACSISCDGRRATMRGDRASCALLRRSFSLRSVARFPSRSRSFGSLAKGAMHGDMHEVLFVFTPEYTKISWQGQSVIGMSYYGFEEWLMTYSSVRSSRASPRFSR